MTISTGSIITISTYNNIRNSISILLDGSTSSYGTNLLESTTATLNSIITVRHWTDLYNDINKCIVHQSDSSIQGVTLPTVGSVVSATFVNNLATSATMAIANSLTVHPNQLRTVVSSTNMINTVWDSEVTTVRNYTWDSIAQAHYHWNLGGFVITRFGYSGTAIGSTDTSFISFVNLSNSDTNFALQYNKNYWANFASTITEYSTSTDVGIFTATVTYTSNVDGVSIQSKIIPPAGILPINLVPISSSTLYVSTGSIGSNLPNIVNNRKILTVDPLSTFSLQAGSRSNPQTLRIRNIGGDTVNVGNITLSQNGVFGIVASTATDFSQEFPGIVALPPTISLAAGAEYNATVFYAASSPPQLGQIGTYFNSITVNSDAATSQISVQTVQTVTAPDFDFRLNLIDFNNQFLYEDWRIENSLSTAQRDLAILIADRYYRSNTDFGIIQGKRRFGLYRQPDSDGLLRYLNYVNTYHGGDHTAIDVAFFTSIDVASKDYTRSLGDLKSFDYGYGYGDFYNKTKVSTDITSTVAQQFFYYIDAFAGSINSTANDPGYTAVLSNQERNNVASAAARQAFGVATRNSAAANGRVLGPVITFNPGLIATTGTYSADLTVTVNATNLNDSIISVAKTVNLSLTVTSLPDANLAQWLSPFEQYNAVVGFSYDRIGNQLYLTWGIGIGADGANTLDQYNYATTYTNVDYLGINGDVYWASLVKPYENLGGLPGTGTGQYQRGMPMYKTNNTQGWTSFMQTYGVWPINIDGSNASSFPVNGSFYYEYVFTAPSTNTYTVTVGVDNSVGIRIWRVGSEGSGAVLVIPSDELFNSYSNTQVRTVSLLAGQYRITLDALYNAGSNSGIAVRITDPNETVIWSTLNAVRPTAPYLYWQEVYRRNLTASTQFSINDKRYEVKNNWPIDVTNVYGLKNFKSYSSFFGETAFSGGVSAANLFYVSSDGAGNIELTWTGAPAYSSGIDFYDTTMSGLSFIPFYYSYFDTRKRNIGEGGPNTQKLIGFNTNGVVTQTVSTPGYSTAVTSATVFIPGIPSSGRGPTSRPGRQYNIYRSAYVPIQGFSVVSRHWIADETSDESFAANRTVAFLHPATTIEPFELANWGFNPDEIFQGRDFIINRIQGNTDYQFDLYWTKIRKNETFPGQFTPVFIVALPEKGRGRASHDLNINYRLPNPALDEAIYLILADVLTAPGPRGFDNLTITISKKETAPYTDAGGGEVTYPDDPGGTPPG